MRKCNACAMLLIHIKIYNIIDALFFHFFTTLSLTIDSLLTFWFYLVVFYLAILSLAEEIANIKLEFL